MTGGLETAAPVARVAAIAVACVLAWTAVGAYASRRLSFPYARLALPTLVVYLLLGLFVEVYVGDVYRAEQIAILAAVLDVTLGYWLVARIGPPRADASKLQLLMGVVLALVSQAAIAFIGATWLLYGVIFLFRLRH